VETVYGRPGLRTAVGRKPKFVSADTYNLYRLFVRSVCDVQRRYSSSCRLWRYLSVMPLPIFKLFHSVVLLKTVART